MLNAKLLIISIMVLYFIIIISIGLFYSKKAKKSSADFFLGGRSLGPLVTAMSAEASDMSGYLLMGLPGLAYFSGISHVGFTAIGLAIGTYLNWLIVAKKLRNYSYVANNSITLPEFISNRYHDHSNVLKVISAIFTLVFFVVYVASCFVTCGKLFSIVFNANYHQMMLIGALIVFLYTMMGGFLAVCTTDLIQSAIMVLALLCVVVFGIKNAGGLSSVIENLSKIPGYLSMYQSANPTQTPGIFAEASNFSFLSIISTLAWGLGYFGVPHVLTKFFAIRDAKEVKLSRVIATIWVVVSMLMAVMIGLVGRYLYMNSAELLSASQAENVFIKLSIDLLPPALCGLALAGILAATMSSADSYLLITASSVVQDIYKGLVNKKASDDYIIKISKFVLLIICILSIFIAWNENSVIFTVVSFAWAGFGATFGPLILFSLFWKRTTKNGALAGMLSGGITVFVWKMILSKFGGIFQIYELLPAFIISCICILIFSLLDKKPDDSIIEEFEKVQSM